MMKQNSKINLKIIFNASLRLTVFLIILSFLLWFFGLYKTNTMEESIDREHVYFQLQQESSPFSVPLEKYLELYAQLCNNSRYDYYECYLQYLQKLPASQEFFDYEMEALSENCEAALCIQVSENLQANNHLECYAGRLLTDKDYQFQGGTIPVVLGYEYRDVFPLGAQFSASYLYDEYTFEVVGILEKDAGIYNPTQMIDLDKYIIMPSFHVADVSDNTDGISIHYANKTSGLIIAPKEDFTYISKDIKQLLADADCGKYSVSISPTRYAIKGNTGIGIEWFIAGSFIALLIAGIFYLRYIRKERSSITQNIYVFTCAELVSSLLFFAVLYVLFIYLLTFRMNIKTFFICEIMVMIIQTLILKFRILDKTKKTGYT